jgi:hypothetical protein
VCNHQSVYLPNLDGRPDEQRIQPPSLTVNDVLCHFAGAFGISQGIQYWAEQDRRFVTQSGQIWKDIRPLLSGDFYLLRPQSETRDAWEAWQFHCPDSGEGIFCVRRLTECTRPEGELVLRGLPDGASLTAETLLGDAEVTLTDPTDATANPEAHITFRRDRAVLVRYHGR